MKKETRNWIWIDWFIFFLRLCWYLTGILYFSIERESLGSLPYLYFAIALTLCYLAPHLFWRPGYFHPVFYPLTELLFAGTASVYVNMILNIDLGTSMLLMTMMMIGFLSTKETAKWTYPIFLLLFPLPRTWSTDIVSFLLSYIDIFIFFGFGASFNYVIHSQQRTKRIIEENSKQYKLIQEQNRVLQQYANQIEKVTLLQERNRLAQDLHDTIGHHFTSVTVGLDAVSYLMEVDVEKAKEKVNVLANVSRKGLEEIRKNIHQIAPSENEEFLSILLRQVATDFKENTNTDVTFTMQGEEQDVSKNMKLALIRCLQESLTNAKRHGEATKISILCIFNQNDLTLLIENNGLPMDTINPGFGIKAMRERTEDLHGKLEITSGKHRGVKLTFTLPLREAYK